MYKKIPSFTIICASIIFTLISCIKNDIPYPIVELYITDIKGNGFTMQEPDNQNRTIVLELDETTDIQNVQISEVSYFPDTNMTKSFELKDTFNMLQPINIVLSLYQDYKWSISANQEIERYFNVEGQIGNAKIDPLTKTATAFVSKSTNLDSITITSLKLGPKDITSMDVNIKDLTTFITYRTVNINYHNTTERWKLYIEPSDIVINISEYDIRSNYADLTAVADLSISNLFGFRYRKINSATWTDVTQDNVTIKTGGFSTRITGLDPNNKYEFIAYIGDNSSPVQEGTTEIELTLKNDGFEDWSFPTKYNGNKNKSWFPFLENGEKYWNSGNQGATTVGDNYNLTTPSEDVPTSSSGQKSARLESKNVLVKFAAGNIFTGTYVGTRGTNGIIGLGRPFTSRPKALKGWLKYSCGIINVVGSIPPGVNIIKDVTKDQGSIYIALGTWTPEKYGISADEPISLGTEEIPMIIDTRDENTFFNKNGDDVIAYGELILTETVGEWTEFTINLDYYDTKTKPTHIIIVCSASRYGDYFTGSSNSVISLDDFKLVY